MNFQENFKKIIYFNNNNKHQWIRKSRVKIFLSKFMTKISLSVKVLSVGCQKQTHKHWKKKSFFFLKNENIISPTRLVDRCCNCTCREGYKYKYKASLTPHYSQIQLENPKESWNVLVQSGRRFKRIFHFYNNNKVLLHNRIKFVVGRGISKATKAFALTGCVS